MSKIWIPSLLFASKPLKSQEFIEFLTANEIGAIIDLRERDPWYSLEISKHLEEIIHLPIKPKETFLDTGRAIKDKHLSMKKLCQKIVLDFMINRKLPILFICNDGFTSSGYLALVCRHWYQMHYYGERSEDFIKENKDYRSCKSKPQIEQARAIAKYAEEIERWTGFLKK